MENQRIRSLDGLRGIFAAIVMCGHFYLIEMPTGAPRFQNVALAVQFFFILSGVALCCGFERKFASGQLSVMGFARQRLARLYPMHLLSMLLAGIFISRVYGAFPTGGNIALDTAANLTLLQAMGVIPGWSWNVVSWSISTEFWVGLILLPIAIKRLSGSIAIALATAGYAAIFLTVYTFERPFPRIIPGVTSAALGTAAGLLAGVAVYRLLARQSRTTPRPVTPWAFACELATFSLILATIYAGSRGYIEVIALVCMPPLIYLAASSETWFSRALASRPLNWLGGISYSLYLIHIPLLGALKLSGIDSLPSIYARFVIFSAVCLLGAHVCFKFVEAPLYRRLRGTTAQHMRLQGTVSD